MRIIHGGVVALFYFFLFFNQALWGYYDIEYIKSFHSDIRVHKDASLTVTETIVYVNNGKRFRGLYRDFPMVYRYKNIFRQVREFTVQKVLRNGEACPFHIKSVTGGNRLYMMKEDIYLPAGTYTYTITYKTNKQLLFLENHDELYWNVNGTQWTLPIRQVSARVTLPDGIAPEKIGLYGYTGRYGVQGKGYSATIDDAGRPVFETTRNLRRRENLTIVVTWPKGFVAAPTNNQLFWSFLEDNWSFFVSLLLFILFLLFSIITYIKKRSTQDFGPIIPLFYPPKELTPADVRYISKIGYDSKVLAAEIVDMAVKGLVKIDYKKSFLGGGTYTLIANKEHIDKKRELKYGFVLDKLFASGRDSVVLDGNNKGKILSAVNKLKKSLKKQYDTKYFLSNMGYFFYSVLFLAPMFIMALLFQEPVLIGMMIAGGLLLFLFWFLMQGYTPDGLKIKNEIEGFKLFLSTTEEDRLKVIGTPPTKTPELYETYLPYAIALGVEEQWSKKFAPVFHQLEERGNAYVPLWYIGTGGLGQFDVSSFSTDLTRSITSYSGSSGSGFGGSGSSGGGGGGGGGGSC